MTRQYTETELIAGSILLVSTIFSIIASIVTLLLIRDMGKWNGYLALITLMTTCQLVYDSAFFFVVDPENSICLYINIFLTSFGGLSVTIWTNIISGVVFYIVHTLKTVNVFQNFTYIFGLGCFFPFCIAAVSTILVWMGYAFLEVLLYNILRLISVAVNIIAYYFLTRKLNQMRSTHQQIIDPLLVLSSRLKYYPLCQVIIRLWPTIYELSYGRDGLFETGNLDTAGKVGLYGFAFCLPLGGVGYFLVFLVMQPYAWEWFKARCYCENIQMKMEALRSAEAEYHLTERAESLDQKSASSAASPFLQASAGAYDTMDEEQLAHEIESLSGPGSAGREDSTGLQSSLWQSFDDDMS